MLLMAVAMMTVAAVNGQEKMELTLEGNILTNYIWRGQDFADFSVQPTFGLSWKGLSLAAFGNMSFDEDEVDEFDISLYYETNGFEAGITDYYFFGGKYFEYTASKTVHTYEAYAGYDFGPLSAYWYTNFAGSDGKTKHGKRAYSSYIELETPFRLAGCQWKATVGAVPWYSTFYPDNNSSGFAVCNVRLMAEKAIGITEKFSLPLFAAISANPSSQKAFFIFGLTLRP